ncbi:MAG: hypothetical protein ACJ8IR_02690 [Alphaproteobacteria bacterium]|jgi:hypothetical protein
MSGRLFHLTVVTWVLLAAQAAHADISISSKPTQNMSCNAGVCVPTARNAVLNIDDLTNMLSNGDLTVQTGDGDGTAAAITIADGFSWTSASRLILSAQKNIRVKAPVTVAGTGALKLSYGKGNPESDLRFERKGKVDFWDLDSSLIINDVGYRLVGDVKTLGAAIANNPAGAYALANDYDAAADGSKKTPVRVQFSGSFEGLGHLINNLSLQGSVRLGSHGHYTGLFPYLLAGSLVRDLTLRHVNVIAATGQTHMGAIAGTNEGTIARVIVSGKVSGSGDQSYIGSIVGFNIGMLRDSAATGISVGSGGHNGSTGGLVGLNYHSGSIIRSAAIGTVSSSGGGLAGDNLGAISQSYADVAVTGDAAGGLAERTYGQINNSYSLGAVSGTEVGGFAAANYSYVRSSYSTGAVSGRYHGGFVDWSDKDAVESSDYWDLNTSGISDPSQGCGVHPPNCPGVTGLKDKDLKSRLPDGFDPKIWGQSPHINHGYPYLLANPPQ